jgi:fumarate hydratase class II
MMKYRIEKDSIGEIEVAEDKLWGAQTQRSFENFKIGTEKMPIEVVHALAMIKKGAALTNQKLGKMDTAKAEAIVAAVDEILADKLNEHKAIMIPFPPPCILPVSFQLKTSCCQRWIA